MQLLDCVVFPSGAYGKEPTCQCRSRKRQGFDPWVGKIPWSRKWQPTPVFLPGESHRQKGWGTTVHRVTKCQTGLKQLSAHTHGNFMFNILQNCLSVFHNSTILHSRQQKQAFQHVRILAIFCFCCCFHIKAILMDVRWCFTVVLTCISLMSYSLSL